MIDDDLLILNDNEGTFYFRYNAPHYPVCSNRFQ
jgi:hypothetical protein